MAPQQPGSTNQQAFADTLLELAEEDRDVVIVTSDSRGSGRLVKFGERLPQQVVEVGIAEQNLVGIAAGLAASGKSVFAVSPACFLTARGLEQIKNDVAYSDRPVKLVGISAGVSYGALGTTHHSLHDLAVLQAINNIDIVVPADNLETSEAVRAAMRHPRPLYIRLGKKRMPHLHPVGTPFAIGTAIAVRTGDDVAFLATGETVAVAVEAADALGQRGISAAVLSVHSLRPFDAPSVIDVARRVRAIVTVEEHSVHGGLGSRVAGLLMQRGVTPPLRIVGIPDEYTWTGSQQEIFEHYGITPAALAACAETLLKASLESVG
jgi:transketolase